MTDERLDELIKKNTMLGDCTSQVFTFYEIKKLIKNIEAQTAKGGQAEVRVMPKIADITRLEIIDHRKNSESYGRLLVLRNIESSYSLQDDNKTLKIFIEKNR